MNGFPRGWTVLLIRRDGRGSRTVRLRPGRLALVAGGVALALLLLGAAAGRLLEARLGDQRTRELEARVERLTAEQERLAELAARMERIESSYGRIREALGGGVAASERDVRLPPAPPAGRGASPVGEERPPRWAWPLAERGFVTRAFGARDGVSPAGHPGVDVAVPQGSYVRAAAAGRVVAAGRDSVYGFYVRIAHGEGLASLYAHNSWLFVTRGDSVEREQVIAVSGSTGRSTAPHLHFEVLRNGEALDPLAFVPRGR